MLNHFIEFFKRLLVGRLQIACTFSIRWLDLSGSDPVLEECFDLRDAPIGMRSVMRGLDDDMQLDQGF